MAINWKPFVKQLSQNAKMGAINQGTGPGKLKVGTVGYDGAGAGTLLCTFTLNDPYATSVNETSTFGGMPKTTQGLVGAGTGAVPATAIFTDSDDIVCGDSMTVGVHVDSVEDPDVVLDAAWIVQNQNITLTALSAVHA